MVSIVILNHNSLKFTRECIESIKRYSPVNTQLVLVNNGSLDGIAEYIQSIPGSTVIVNRVTKGRTEAINQGVIAARGEYVVLLNENTIVTKEWLHRMLWWLQTDPSIGIVGVRTNLADNSQKVEKIPYKTIQEMNGFSALWSERYSRQGYKADDLSDVCIMFHHDLAAQIGIFDERLSLRHSLSDFFIRTMIVEKKLWVANDVFIHSIDRVLNNELNKQLDNKRELDEKWNSSRWENFAGIAHREKPFDRKKHYYP